MNQLYDVNIAARQLAVSPWTVRAYIRQGKLRPVRIGRLIRLEEEELRRFVTQCRASAAIASVEGQFKMEEENG
jgi:excisionase family DNA binding protein